MNKQGLDAWDERFNHIDDHHFKKGSRIHQWYELDRDIPNGLLRNGHFLDSGFPSVDPDTSNSDESDDNGLDDSSGNTPVQHATEESVPCHRAASTRDRKNHDNKDSDIGGGGGGGRGSASLTRWVCVSTLPD